MPWCERHDVAVVAYTPFGPGAFPSVNTPGGRLLAEIATAHDATPRQAVLAWLARRSFVIPKASSAAHAAENAGAGDLELSTDEAKRIEEAFPRGAKPRGLPML
jgi:diketogulonate reductase-like aldo/keto reductase